MLLLLLLLLWPENRIDLFNLNATHLNKQQQSCHCFDLERERSEFESEFGSRFKSKRLQICTHWSIVHRVQWPIQRTNNTHTQNSVAALLLICIALGLWLAELRLPLLQMPPPPPLPRLIAVPAKTAQVGQQTRSASRALSVAQLQV